MEGEEQWRGEVRDSVSETRSRKSPPAGFCVSLHWSQAKACFCTEKVVRRKRDPKIKYRRQLEASWKAYLVGEERDGALKPPGLLHLVPLPRHRLQGNVDFGHGFVGHCAHLGVGAGVKGLLRNSSHSPPASCRRPSCPHTSYCPLAAPSPASTSRQSSYWPHPDTWLAVGKAARAHL